MRNVAVPIDPKLPARFSQTPNDARPASHQRWWGRPYIQTATWDENRGTGGTASDEELAEWRTKWFECWPSGTRYDVRCLDGGAWDRPTCWGMFATLDEALLCAATGPAWRRIHCACAPSPSGKEKL